MKIAATDKGGVGKTTFSSMLSRAFADDGYRVVVVGNKVRNKEDEEFIMSNLEDGEVLGFIYYNPNVINSDRSNKSPYDTSQETRNQIEVTKNKLMGLSVFCN